ncbi:MAG TPA: hypothetical protein VKA46_25790, partial [Gemmataceae bacterium]|nr:hypothetical protein [Gemmataceae bacterium]
ADDEPPQEENVFRSNSDEILRGAATLAGAGCQGGHGSAMVLGLAMRGEQRHLWTLQSDKALWLSPSLLKRVKDRSEIRVDDSGFEPEAYCEAVWKSSLVSLGAFANSARYGVTFAELLTDPHKYRGEVIHYEGQVRRIRSFDAPSMLRAKGIKELYECWLFGSQDGANPVCLVCTELPERVTPGEKLSLVASFDAYFFKEYRYQAVSSKDGQARLAPLFIGRSFVLTKAPPSSATGDAFASGSKTLLLIFLGGVFATFVFAFVLHWWFRRGDRRVYAKIKEVRTRDYPDPGTPEVPGTPAPTN